MITSKESDCWYTPPKIIDVVCSVLGQISLDPCADADKHVPAQLHYTITDNGLDKPWVGNIYLNPPYSCPKVWMEKLNNEYLIGNVTAAIALVPAATDTNWLHPLMKTQPICFWKGRIKFLDKDYIPRLSARQSHCALYWGNAPFTFKGKFSPHGVVYMP